MKEKKYQAVVFDLDGTLLNTLEDLKDSVNYALRAFGMPERTHEEIRSFVGNGLSVLVERAVPMGRENPRYEEVFGLVRSYYQLHCNDKTDLYPGVKKLLGELKKRSFQLAIVSNKYHEGVQELKKQYFEGLVETAVGEQEAKGIRKKPEPDMVLCALKSLGVTREQAVYVGDSEVDIQTAQNTGMDCIAVEWGFRTRREQELAGGKVFADTPEKLLELLYCE